MTTDYSKNLNYKPEGRPLAPSVTSVTSVANDNGSKKIMPGAVHRSPGICLTAEEYGWILL